MPVPAYIEILDSEIDPNSPITTTLMTKLRDNMLAIIGGGVDAPNMEPGLLNIGGSRADGTLTNAWAPTEAGYFDFESDEPSTLSSGRTLPFFTYVRHQGDLEISAAQTLDTMTRAEVLAAEAFGASPAGRGGDDDGTGVAYASGGGGGHHANGGSAGVRDGGFGGGGGDTTEVGGYRGFGRPLTSLLRWWISKRIPMGNTGGDKTSGGDYGKAGGVFVLVVEGDLDMTGGTISANGGNGSGAGGGGAGGTIIILCTGTITGGTFNANGGDAGGLQGGGGSGGAIALVASAFSGSQVFAHAGGDGGHGGGHPSGNTGGAGYDVSVTLAPELLRGLFWR